MFSIEPTTYLGGQRKARGRSRVRPNSAQQLPPLGIRASPILPRPLSSLGRPSGARRLFQARGRHAGLRLGCCGPLVRQDPRSSPPRGLEKRSRTLALPARPSLRVAPFRSRAEGKGRGGKGPLPSCRFMVGAGGGGFTHCKAPIAALRPSRADMVEELQSRPRLHPPKISP